VTGTTSFTVTASRDAPGLHLLECKFSGLVESAQPQAIPDSSEASVSMAFTVEYAGRAEARAPQTVAEAGPQKVAAFDIEVANHFNAQTTFVAELADAPPEGWRVIVPPPLTLDAVQLGGGRVQDTMTVVVQTPYQEGMNVGELPFSVRLRPSASLDASLQAEPVTLSFVAKVRGLYCSDIEKPVPECEEAIDAIVDACERGEPPEGFQEEACTPILQARSRSSPAPGAAILVALGAVALAVRRRRHVP
jgi:MYXO-CTERM domain-containing protein